MTLQPEAWAGVKRFWPANAIALLMNSGSLAPMTRTVLVSATPLGSTTNSTAALSPGCIFEGAGGVRGVPATWANGRASSETYFDKVSEIAEHRSSSAENVMGFGPRAQAAARTASRKSRLIIGA